MLSSRAFHTIASASVSLVMTASLTSAQGCDLPISGCEVRYLDAVDTLMNDFMCVRDIPGATLAISMDGVVVYERGFGWSDEDRTDGIEPDALMRIASVSKPITAAAIRELIDDGLLSLDSHAFDLGQPGGGVLPIDPFPAIGDARLREITIDHLLQHRGGWDRNTAGDLTYREVVIANTMGIPSPPGRMNTMRYILGQPLQSDPGGEYHYSNIGYLTLGLIVEHLSGQALIEFVHERVLDPLGVDPSEHLAGRTFAADQSPREPHYHSTPGATNVFDPGGTPVPWAYGGWDHEARVGQGGQITTTSTLLAFLNDRYISGPSIGVKLPPDLNPGYRRNHTGSLSGTESLARQRGDGISYAVIFNERSNSSPNHASSVRTALDTLFDSGEIDWPDTPVETCQSPYDLNGDGTLNFFDFSVLISMFGDGCNTCDDCPADFSGDCAINFFDVSIMLAAYVDAAG
ncbi:MAG: serine hydrolase [Phycisphaerales bacterium]